MNVKRSWGLPVLLGGTFASVLMSSCASSTPVTTTPVTSTPATAVALPATSNNIKNWPDITAKDIDAVVTGYQRNHPGVLDADNPEFEALLKTAQATSHKSAKGVTSRAGHDAVLNELFTGFHDYHSYWGTKEGAEDPALKWPGFVVGLRSNKVTVTNGDPTRKDIPPVGSVLQSCDGKPADELMKTRIARFYGNLTVPSDMVRAARFLTINDGNPLLSTLKTCAFSVDGTATEFKLVWSQQTDQARTLFKEAAGGHVEKESLTIGNDGVAWIAFPSFSGDYSKLIDEIHSKIDQVRSSKAIVLDLRGNGGGSSDWGNQVASELWGADFVRSASWNGLV
jgi:Peptidase family S41